MYDDIEEKLRKAEFLSQLVSCTDLDDVIYEIMDLCVQHMGTVKDPNEALRLSGMLKFGEMLIHRIRGHINVGKRIREKRHRETQRITQAAEKAAQRNKRFTTDAAI